MSDDHAAHNTWIGYLKTENDRLQTLLRAERKDNARLRAAIAHLKEAVGTGSATIYRAFEDADDNTSAEVSLKYAENTMRDLIDKADALILPLAE